MAETYTIESADASVPIDPRLLRELRDLLRDDDDMDIAARLRDRPPAPGEQGAVPDALEIIAIATPLGTAFARVLINWINSRKVSISLRHKDSILQVSSGSAQDAERLMKMLGGAGPGDGD